MEKKDRKMFEYKKLGIFFAFLVTAMIVVAMIGINYNINIEDGKLTVEPKSDYELTWHDVVTITFDSLGDYDPGTGAAGWIASFHFDYAETPSTSLNCNASGAGGYYNTWTNVSGFVDADNQETDLKSEDLAYIVIRARFNASVKDGGNFNAKRCRCNLTVSGDETISDVGILGDDTNLAGGGGAFESFNDSSEPFIYINFCYDDNVDGYRITDDGTLTWSITLAMQY